MIVLILCVLLIIEIYLFVRYILPHRCPMDTPRFTVYSNPVPDAETIDRLRRSFIDSGRRTTNANTLADKLDYHFLRKHFPSLVDDYTSDTFIDDLSRRVGHPVYLSSEDDPNRLFVKNYCRSDDGQSMHYDLNFSTGSRYTLLVVLYVNDSNTSHLVVRDCSSGVIETVSLLPGQGYFYDATNILHGVLPQSANGERMVLVLPLYTTRIHNRFIRYIHQKIAPIISI